MFIWYNIYFNFKDLSYKKFDQTNLQTKKQVLFQEKLEQNKGIPFNNKINKKKNQTFFLAIDFWHNIFNQNLSNKIIISSWKIITKRFQ